MSISISVCDNVWLSCGVQSMEREREFYLEEAEQVKRQMSAINVDQLKFQVQEKKKSLSVA